MAGGLVNCAFLGLARIYQVCAAAGTLRFCQEALLALGFTSLLFAAVFAFAFWGGLALFAPKVLRE